MALADIVPLLALQTLFLSSTAPHHGALVVGPARAPSEAFRGQPSPEMEGRADSPTSFAG